MDVEKQKYSLESPIGKAVRGKKAGDGVDLVSPKEKVFYTIVEVM